MRPILFISMLFSFGLLQAQASPGSVWDLQTCIREAIKNSLDVRSAELNVEQAGLNLNQAKMNRLPDLNMNSGVYNQYGRNIDRFTNTYVQSAITSNNFQANSNVFLFAGGQLRNNIQSNKYTWLASESDLANVELNISLNVSNIFLQVAQARELVKSYGETLANTNAQLEKAQKQFDAGVINEGGLLNLKAQKANDENNIVTARNTERTSMTNLKLLLRIPFEQNFDIQLPTTGIVQPQEYPDSLNTIFDSAISRRPDIKASEMRLKASQYRRRVAMGAYMPTLSMTGNASSVYSSSAKNRLPNPTYDGWYAFGRVQGSNTTVEIPNWVYKYETIKYGTQLKNNFGQYFGFGLSIPVFNKRQTNTNVKLADIDMERNKIALERSKQNLYNEVVTAYNAFQTALNKLRANKLSAVAQAKNLEFVQKKYDAGQTSTLDFQIAKATESAARVNLVSVQYEYIFRKLVLDYYMGQKLEIK